VTSIHGGVLSGEGVALGPLMLYPADAIVDAETGCLLRLISNAGDGRLAIWSELDDISTGPADPDEFGCTCCPAPAPWRKPAT
jgi:hypothetical protein